MALTERESIHHKLLDALYDARKQVQKLEAALAHNAAFLGAGVEREGQMGTAPPQAPAGRSPEKADPLMAYLGLVEPEEDISNYIGREGHDESRPRLGPDAPPSVRPDKKESVSMLVSQVAFGHPDDALSFAFPSGSVPVTGLPGTDPHTSAPPAPAAQQYEGGNTAPPSFISPVAETISGEGSVPAAPRQPVAKQEQQSPQQAPAQAEAVAAAPATKPVIPVAHKNVKSAQGKARQPSHPAPGKVSPTVPEQPHVCPQYSDDDILRAVLALQAVNDGIWDWNMRTGMVHWTDRWKEILGSVPAQGQDPMSYLFTCFAPEDVRMLRPKLAALLQGQEARLSTTVRFKLHDVNTQSPDVWGWGLLRAVALRENGQPVRLTIVLADVTIPQKAYISLLEEGGIAQGKADAPETGETNELRLNEARLAALYRLSHMDSAQEENVVRFCLEQAVKLTGSRIGYLYVDSPDWTDGADGKIYWSNAVMALRAEKGTSGAKKDPWTEIKGGQALDKPGMLSLIEDGPAKLFGDSIQVGRYMFAPIYEDNRLVCAAVVANKEHGYESADLRQLELFINGMWFHMRRRWAVESLTRAKNEAEAANKAKNVFLANVSHELRTPLNGVLGMLQVLQQSPLNAEQTEWVRTAVYSTRSLLRIISDILDFARIEAGLVSLNAHPFDFSATVRSALGMFIHQEKDSDVELSVDLAPDIPRVLLGDDARLRQIIFNLVGNAFKFTRKGRVSVTASTLPYCPGNRCCLYFSVTDSGIGIPDDRVTDIFKAFTQLDGSFTRRFPGTGLGLSIVRRLVETMGGSLTIESEEGSGTTVHCSLPFDQPEPNADPRRSSRLPEVTPPPLKILVVEDDPVNMFTLQVLLKKGGHSIVCASDGRQALEVLQLVEFDCIITDIQMPVMDGIEMVRRIRQEDVFDVEPLADTKKALGLDPDTPCSPRLVPKDIPIVALTAHAMDGDRNRLLSLGMDYYLEKPVIASALSDTLGHVALLLQARKEKAAT